MTTTDTNELVSFMRARLDEAEASTTTGDCQCEYHDVKRPDCPDFVLADVEAKRRILDEYEEDRDLYLRGGGSDVAYGGYFALEWAVRVLAQPFTSHPEFRESWSL